MIESNITRTKSYRCCYLSRLLVASREHVAQTSYACRADVVRMSPKLVDKVVPGSANFYTARSDEKWRHIHDVCTSLCDTSTTSARHAYEMKSRTRILNRLKILAATCRVLATCGDISTTCEDICTSSTRHMTSYCEL